MREKEARERPSAEGRSEGSREGRSEEKTRDEKKNGSETEN